MSNLIIIYSTTDGHTLQICQRLAQVLEPYGHKTTLVAATACDGLDLTLFDKIVIGASIRYGRHSPLLVNFIKNNVQVLDSKPNAFFSVNLVARKAEKSQPGSNPYLRKFLKQITWKPKNLAVFAGKIDYPRYSHWDRCMIRLIMWITQGPTDPTAVIEFTNWRQVEEFGKLIAEM